MQGLLKTNNKAKEKAELRDVSKGVVSEKWAAKIVRFLNDTCLCVERITHGLMPDVLGAVMTPLEWLLKSGKNAYLGPSSENSEASKSWPLCHTASSIGRGKVNSMGFQNL